MWPPVTWVSVNSLLPITFKWTMLVFEATTTAVNSIFEHHVSVEAVGQGTTISSARTLKPPRPPSNLSPIALISIVHKDPVNNHSTMYLRKSWSLHWTLPAWIPTRMQLCRHSIGTTCVCFPVMSKHWAFYRMCIGMPKSFGTMKWSKIPHVLDRTD